MTNVFDGVLVMGWQSPYATDGPSITGLHVTAQWLSVAGMSPYNCLGGKTTEGSTEKQSGSILSQFDWPFTKRLDSKG